MNNIMAKLSHLARRFHHDDDGLTAAELMIIAGLIMIPLVIALTYFRDEVTKFLKTMWDKIKGQTGDAPSSGGGWK